MNLVVNGKEMNFTQPPTGATLLAELQITPATVVTELNGEVIPRSEFLELPLADGDVLELVTVVGGG
jgi:sulfur carrier protein